MLDGTVAYVSDPELRRRADEMNRVITSSETLRAGYLERMRRAQRLVVARLEERLGGDIGPLGSPIAPAALVAAAFAALSEYAEAHRAPFAEALDDAMGGVSIGAQQGMASRTSHTDCVQRGVRGYGENLPAEVLVSYVAHANAKLTPGGRVRLFRLVVDEGWTQSRVAQCFHRHRVTATEWVAQGRI